MSEQQDRRVVVVLGMHRSGTSAIARALQALGVDLGDRLMPPLAGVNDKGFLEDEDVVQLNVGLLRALGHDWHTLALVRTEDFSTPAVADFRIRAVDLLRERLRERPVFGLKDPRMARLLPFWKSVFTHLDAQVGFVISLRNPLSVARSLKARDDFDDEKSFFLWLQHIVPSFTETEGSPRVVVDYDLMMDDPAMQLGRIARALSLPFERNSEALYDYTARFLERGLRHTRFEAQDLALVSALPREAAAVFQLVRRLARDELSADAEQVHTLMHGWAEALKRLGPAWDYMVRCENRIADFAGRAATFNRQAAELAARIPSLQQTLSERDGQISALNQVLAERNEQLFVLNQWLGDRDKQLAILNRDLSERDARIAAHDSNLRKIEGRIAALSQELSERDGKISALSEVLAERNEQVFAYNQWLAARDEHIAMRDRILSERDARIIALDQALSQRNANIAALVKDLAGHEERVAVLERALFTATAQRDELLASTSWRVTRPLRAIRALLGSDGDPRRGEPVSQPSAEAPVPVASHATPFFYNLDQLVVERQALMAYGWIFNTDGPIKDLSLKVISAGVERLFHAMYGKARGDVLASYEGKPQARFSGFMVLAAWTGDAVDALALTGTLEEGGKFDIPLPVPAGNMVEVPHSGASGAIARQWLSLGKRALLLAGSGRFDLLYAKIRKLLDSRIHGATVRSQSDLRRLLGSEIGREAVLVIDHAMGGGANQYRQLFVEEKRAEGKLVALLCYQIASLSLVLTLLGRDFERMIRIPAAETLPDLLDALALKEIFYNDAVSFVQPEQVPELLVALKARHPDAMLTMAVHDYFAICPSPFLLNDKGVYCGAPGGDICRACLSVNGQPFVSMFPSRDIAQWRALWSAALQASDRIIAFSHSSVDIMRRAYPATDADRFIVRPHVIDAQRFPAIIPPQTETLHIGVLGHIGQHKGADIIKRLADEIARREESIKITVIGTLEAVYRQGIITETGPYRPEELPDLVMRSGANVFLFPSVCPETFSFVVGELIQMTLPVACFDIGAPAERVKTYGKGRVLASMDPGQLLEELIDFHMTTYALGEAYE